MATIAAPTTSASTSGELVNGADILVQSLVNHGVEVIFAYPGGASMPLHQALTKFRDSIARFCRGMSKAGAFQPKDTPALPAGRGCAWRPAARARLTW